MTLSTSLLKKTAVTVSEGRSRGSRRVSEQDQLRNAGARPSQAYDLSVESWSKSKRHKETRYAVTAWQNLTFHWAVTATRWDTKYEGVGNASFSST